MSVRAIAAVLGVSPSTVVRDLHRTERYQADADGMISVGLTKGRDGRVRPDRLTDTRQRDAQIRKLRKAQLSVRAIAAEVGCSVGTVHRVINKGK